MRILLHYRLLQGRFIRMVGRCVRFIVFGFHLSYIIRVRNILKASDYEAFIVAHQQ